MRPYACADHTWPQALHSNVMRVWLLTSSVRGRSPDATGSIFRRTVHARVSTCRHSWRIPNPAQGRGRNGPLVIADLAPHPDFIRGPRVFADNLDFIIDPHSSARNSSVVIRRESSSALLRIVSHSPAARFRIQPNAPKRVFVTATSLSIFRREAGRRESPGNRQKGTAVSS